MSMLGKMLGFGRNEQYDRAIRLFDQGLYEEAIDAFQKARKNDKQDPLTERLALFYTAEANANLGNRELKRGVWDRAEQFFRAALAIHPHYADLHFNLGLTLRKRQQYEEAMKSMQNALEINPRFAKAHYYSGLTQYAFGERDQGIQSIKLALELEPAFDTEAVENGLTAHKSEGYETALAAFEAGAATEVDDIQFHFRLGDDLYRRGMMDDAVEEYRMALELNPNYVDIRNHLGLALMASGRPKEAVTEFDRAISGHPGFSEAWVNLGIAQRELGNREQATRAFHKALEIDPDNLIVKQNLADVDCAIAA